MFLFQKSACCFVIRPSGKECTAVKSLNNASSSAEEEYLMIEKLEDNSRTAHFIVYRFETCTVKFPKSVIHEIASFDVKITTHICNELKHWACTKLQVLVSSKEGLVEEIRLWGVTLIHGWYEITNLLTTANKPMTCEEHEKGSYSFCDCTCLAMHNLTCE